MGKWGGNRQRELQVMNLFSIWIAGVISQVYVHTYQMYSKREVYCMSITAHKGFFLIDVQQ